MLPGGGCLIDTPGMRELQLWEAAEGLERAFADVEQLAAECRFRDCAHETEPGCAVQAADRRGSLLGRAAGELSGELQRELEFQQRRGDKRAPAAAKKQWATFSSRCAVGSQCARASLRRQVVRPLAQFGRPRGGTVERR